MPLRFIALLYILSNRIFSRKNLLFLLLLLCCERFYSQSSLETTKRDADKFFEDDEFTKAYPLYSQLVANFPKDIDYNFKLGVCMIYSEPDKKKCLPFLQFANGNPTSSPKETKFYLGKAYHVNYLFDEAIKYYNEYKRIGSALKQKKLQVDREIKACGYGKHLLSNLSDLVIMSKKTLNESDYFRSYDLKGLGGKLLVKPEDFKTPPDKKKKDKSIIYLPKNGERVYFSSYGANTEEGRDIYYKVRLPNGTFGLPQKVKGINTEFDEDYPFLHPNGNIIYFASKGFNSMGGYDIFKSTYNAASDSWNQPENLEFPINSPDDDFLFVTDSLEKTAYFCTGRQSLPGKIDVLRISTERKPIDFLSLKGTVTKEKPDQSQKSIISVKNISDGNTVSTYESQDNGEYAMDLPNGAKLLFTVETPGLQTQSEEVVLPMAVVSKPLKQIITYEKDILKIVNYFDESISDESYLQYLKIIEQKAKLNVNLGQNNLGPQVVNNDSSKKDSLNTVNNNTQTVVNDTIDTKAVGTNTVAKQSVSNKQLADLAKQDAEESKKEALQFKQDANDAFELGNTKKIDADKKIAEADEALKVAEAITNEDEKKSALEKATSMKLEAEIEKSAANKIIDYAKTLEADAGNKQKIAELNDAYVKELDKVINTKNNNKDAIDKLDALQKQINDLSAVKNQSDDVYNSIKNDVDEKEKQLAIIEQTNADLKTNIQELKTEITTNESDLTKAKKKQKPEIEAKINELKTELSGKEKQVAVNEQEIKKLKDDLIGSKNELDLANRIKNETIAAVNTNTTPITQTEKDTTNSSLKIVKKDNELANKSEKITSKTLADKYKDKVIVTDNSNKSNIEESTSQLKNFNKDIDAAIAKDKGDLTKIKNQTAKQELLKEIKKLEGLRKQNQQQIAVNNKLIENIDKPALATDNKNNQDLSPISSNNTNDAIKKLNTLNEKLNVNNNSGFDYNGYQNPQAQSLKIEADAKINEVAAQQKKLQELAIATKDQILNTATVNTTINESNKYEKLNKEAEENSNKALEYRNEAKNKEGVEKDSLIAKAKGEENKANDKRLQASDVMKNTNTSVFEINTENIQTLKKENKAVETDLNEVNKLLNEADIAYKQAISMRDEANSLQNIGAKLGSLGNAEEKEAEAINKQKQAIDILKKTSPDVVLKTPSNNTTDTLNLKPQLEAVNASINDLANAKIIAYQKLYEANKLEIEQLNATLKTNQILIDKTPALKTEFISGNNKIAKSENQKQASDATTNNNDKLKNLIPATKLQVEGINQLNNLVKNLNPTVAKADNNTANDKEVSSTNTVVAKTTNTISENNENTTPNTNTVTLNNTDTETASTKTIDVNELAKTDTSVNQVVNYFEENKLNLKNPGANQLVKNALVELKNIETENTALENQIKNSVLPNNNSNETPDQLKTKAESALTEAEDLSTKAFDLRKSGNEKTGGEKDSLIAKAKDLEDQSQNKKLEAVKIIDQSNQLSYNDKNNAILQLMDKLKTDNPTLASQLDQTNNEISILKNQGAQLRIEANALTNNNAKIGSFMNAEEKEAEMLLKQNNLLTELKKQYPDYVVKVDSNTIGGSNSENIKQKQLQLREKKYNELTNLTNAFSLEFETSKNNVPENLNNNQKLIKQNADNLNTESKNLLIKSSQEINENEKIKLLALAAKTGNAAVEQLNKIVKPTVPIVNNPPRNNRPANNLVNNNPPNNRPNNGKTTIKVEGLEVIAGNAYNENKPIPLDSKMPDGLVFRVQIGAFKSLLPNGTFKGLNPVNAETTPSGYIRYTAGNFNKIENATAVKTDLNNLGYRDAFIVVYYNGKRISYNEAMALLAKEGKTLDINAPSTAGITANANIPIINNNPTNPNIPPQDAVKVTKELEQINGLLYTIQIGLYTKQVTQQQLLNLTPIYSEKLTNGLYRYTAGIYGNIEKLISDKNKVNSLGVRDAFASAYFNGKRISFDEGKIKQQDSTTKMEPENPIVFPEGNIVTNNSPDNNTPVNPIPNNNPNTPTVQPFSNGVNNYPDSTPENGIKSSQDGVCFKVQIGAYSRQVPNEVASKFSTIKTWPIENKQVNNLYIYNIGNFTGAKFAKTLKDEVVKAGINDAFITVYRDGKKLYGTEATQLLNQ